MTERNIKFTAANLTAMILMAFVLIPNYTLYGFIAYIAGSGLLFLGTLLDKNKAMYGITAKLAYMIWICLLTMAGIRIPVIVQNIPVDMAPVKNTKVAGVIIFLLLWLVSLWVYHNKKHFHYVVKRLLKYLSLIFMFASIYFFWGISFNTFNQIAILTLIFMLTDIYYCKVCSKVAMNNDPTYVDSNRDKAFMMALSLDAVILVISLLFHRYFDLFFTRANILEALKNATSGYSAPLFCGFMIALAVIFKLIYTKKENFSYNDIGDCYFVLSLGGFYLLLMIYLHNLNVKEPTNNLLMFIILTLALIAYFIFGFSIPSADSGSKKNPVYCCIRKSKDTGVLISLLITALSVPAMIFVCRGYLVPILFFLFCGAISVTSFVLLRGSWIRKCIAWQIMLTCVLAYLISLGAVNINLQRTLPYIVLFYIVCSLAVWCMGIRQDILRTKFRVIIQSLICCVFGISGIIAAGSVIIP